MSNEQKKSSPKCRTDLNEFTRIKTIGIGSTGRVVLCQHKKSGKPYVMKILKKYEIINLKQVDHLYSEYKILSIMNHPFIVELKGANSTDPKYLYLILEYVQGGELFTLLRANEKFPFKQARFYAAHIVCIFTYLHERNIVYRDLKPENILISKTGYLKLTDFGFAKVIKGKTYTLCGTPEYLAPEIIQQTGHGFPVDWWTLGILIYEMLVGIDPFSDDNPMNIYQKIIECNVRYPRGMDKNAKNLIKKLLVVDTTKRIGCLKNGSKDIINNPFFKDFDWKEFIYMRMIPDFIPVVKSESDTSNFGQIAESDEEVIPVDQEIDPFYDW